MKICKFCGHEYNSELELNLHLYKSFNSSCKENQDIKIINHGVKFDLETNTSQELETLQENKIALFKQDLVYKREKGYLVYIGSLLKDTNLVKTRLGL